MFADILIHNKELAKTYEIAIRRSFHSFEEEQDKAEYLLTKHGIQYHCVEGDLIHAIDNADVIIYESTSAAFQASLRGKIVIQMQLSDILPTDHFYGFDGESAIKFCKNAKSLQNHLEYINELSDMQYQTYADRQRQQVEMVFSKNVEQYGRRDRSMIFKFGSII